jgi:putative ABC transport system permease protein
MGIIVKYVLRNIIEKKLRTFLILFSILLSSALFFASQAVTDNVVKMFLADARQFYGSTDIMVYPEKGSPSPYLKISQMDSFAPKTEYVIGALQGSAYYNHERRETVTINLRGTTLEDMNIINPVFIEGTTDEGSFSGRKIILSKKAAEKYGYKIGDSIKLEIQGEFYRFTIYAVANPEGFFAESGQTVHALLPKSTLSSIYGGGNSNLNNIIFVGLKDGIDLNQSTEELKGIYKRYGVEEPVPEEDMKRNVQSMSVGFMMMTLVVGFMSIFIIYTSFKVITLERLPMIGTFRSIGATRRTTDLVLLAESLLYGVIGGIIGCVLGVGILYLIVSFITPSYMKGYGLSLVYTPAQMGSAFLVAVLISLASSVIPIIKTSKIPVKDIVLNSMDKKAKSKFKRYLLGAILLVLYILLPPLVPEKLAIAADSISMMFSLIGVILLLPLITSGFVLLFEKIYVLLFGNIGVIAAKNLRQNKNILNNISLLSIAISSLLMITTISDSVLLEVASFYTRSSNFDIYMSMPGAGRSFEQSLTSVDGVKQVCGNISTNGIEVVGKDYKLVSAYGINTEKFPDFFLFDMEGDKKAQFEALNKERSLIMSNNLREKLGFKKGDMITLKMNKGDVAYKIIAFQNTMLDNGSNVMISDKFFKADTGIQTYTELFIRSEGDPDKTVAAIKKKYIRNQPTITTMKQMEKENYEINSSVFRSMEAFAYLTLIIGIFGIINNYIISFIERKRSLAMYRSIGMSKRQTIKMMIVESVTSGLIGAIMGITAGLMMIYTVPYVMKALFAPMPILLNPLTFVLSFLLGVVITFVASISPIMKSSKLNLVTALKYE